MKKAKRLVALCCIGTIAVCFAACKPDTPEEITTTSEVQQTETTTQEAESTTLPPETTTETATEGAKEQTKAEILAIYNEAYNKTKAAGSLLGKDVMSTGDVIWGGNPNKTLTNVVSTIVKASYESSTTNALSPKASGFETSKLTEEDLASAEIKDNGNSWYVKLVPVDSENPTPGSAGAGRLFDIMPDITPYLDIIPGGIKFTSGTAAENMVVKYSGGYAEVTIDKTSGMITSAKYDAVCTLNINNAKVVGLTVNGASIRIEIVTSFPA